MGCPSWGTELLIGLSLRFLSWPVVWEDGSVAAGLEWGGRQKEKGTVGAHQHGSATSG